MPVSSPCRPSAHATRLCNDEHDCPGDDLVVVPVGRRGRPGQSTAGTTAVRSGCQTRTFGEGIYKNEAAFLAVVRQVGEVGFEGIETNAKNLERWFDRPADFATILKQSHLRLIGAHTGVSPWSATPRSKQLADVERAARFVKRMDGQFIVLSGSLPKQPLPPDTWQKLADFVNEIGRVCATAASAASIIIIGGNVKAMGWRRCAD